jgi:hypothetical protein
MQYFGEKKKEMGVVISTSDVKYTKMTGEIIESNGLQRQTWRYKVQPGRRGVVCVVIMTMMP